MCHRNMILDAQTIQGTVVTARNIAGLPLKVIEYLSVDRNSVLVYRSREILI
jgi:hypothetical protein